MRWFGKKSDERTVKITEFFTEEELKEFRDVFSRHMFGARYKSVYHQTTARQLIGYASNLKTDYSYDKIKGIKKTLETAMVMEPSLEPKLKEGLDKIHAFEKEQGMGA